MKDNILLFESRDLCYESNRYFMECFKDAFEELGYRVDICDLSIGMEKKLEDVLNSQEKYFFAMDFNSLLPRMELEDGTPYLEAFKVLFFNYLVDHPLYHHAGIKRSFPKYSVICIDQYHKEYIEQYYPHIERVYYLPIGAMPAEGSMSLDPKRFELLFLGTYEPENELYQQLEDYSPEHRKEVVSLIEMLEADYEMTQEEAYRRYLLEKGEILDHTEFARRLNQNYLADKYLRNLRRKKTVMAAKEAKIPFTIMGHGWDMVEELRQSHVTLHQGVGFAVSVKMIADAKRLLNTTPGFLGGLHDRVYSARMNHTLCFTEKNRFAEKVLRNGVDALLYDPVNLETLTEQICRVYENPQETEQIAEWAYQKAVQEDTWLKRAGQILEIVSCFPE